MKLINRILGIIILIFLVLVLKAFHARELWEVSLTAKDLLLISLAIIPQIVGIILSWVYSDKKWSFIAVWFILVFTIIYSYQIFNLLPYFRVLEAMP